MPKTEETFDVQEIFASEDLSPAKLMELRRLIHCSIDRRTALESLVEGFASVARKLSSENKAETRRATMLWTLGRVEDAIPIFEKTRTSRERAFLLGVSYLDVGKPDLAVPLLKEALEVDSSDACTAAALAEAESRSGHFDSAESHLERQLKKHPDDAALVYVKGLWFDLQGYRDNAIEQYERALELEPGHPPSQFRLAYLFDLRGEEGRAMELYEQLRSTRPVHVNTMINLGLLYEDRSEYEKAEECFRAVLEYFPSHPRARLYLKDAQASLSMFYDEDAARREAKAAQILNQPLTEINFSQRVRNALQKLGLVTLGDLISRSEEELLEIPNFGKTSLREVKEFLTTKGLNLASAVGEADAAEAAGSEAEPESEVMNKPLSEFEWSGRIRKVFEKLGAVTVADLLQHSEQELLKSKNLGGTSIKEIRQKLGAWGVAMRPE
ncbi:MAG: tetratricopeptide repeat protein [Planctomycetes bacterium]|nr:tetratricopeptide repeat protein [Planctomycetota bacterium]